MRFQLFLGFKLDLKFLIKILNVLIELLNEKVPAKPI